MDDANEVPVTRNTTAVLRSNYDNLVGTEANLLPPCKIRQKWFKCKAVQELWESSSPHGLFVSLKSFVN